MMQAPIAQTPLNTAKDLSQYMIHSRVEMIGVLRDIIERRSLVTITYGHINESIVSALLSVNPEFEEVVLDFGSDSTANQRLLAASALTITTYVEHVKIQFSVQRAETTIFEGGPAIRVRLPESLMRLQRREHYRISTPVIKPLKCVLPELLDRNGKMIEFRVVDLSCGGLAMVTNSNQIHVDLGQKFDVSQIELHGIGMVTAGLIIRSITEIPDSIVMQGQRCGCQFINLPGTMITLIQRYINSLQRERRALS
jgi:flagellar brake protein